MGKYDEQNDFWDISKLVPKKKTKIFGFSQGSKSVPVVVGEDASLPQEGSADASERKLTFEAYSTQEKDIEPVRTYSPGYNRLIRSVTVKPIYENYDFHDSFRKNALAYFDYEGEKCEFCYFYSFKPQYSQMTAAQRQYYFYWRSELRRGNCIRTDYSYIYLYAYEIINLPDRVDKNEGLALLCRVWREYRKSFPRIDTYLAAWIQDYCLIHELPCPLNELDKFIFDAVSNSSFKEFYLSDISVNDTATSAMLGILSDYDWRCGKYASGDRAAGYKLHMEAVMRRVLASLLSDNGHIHQEMRHISRRAFDGALCTHKIRCMLEIDYYSLSDADFMRSSVTAAVRYAENKLRAALGVKSRLAVKELQDEHKTVIDAYFAEVVARDSKKASLPEYEKLYDAPTSEISFESAIEIERASWRVTSRLVEDTESESSECLEDVSCDGGQDSVASPETNDIKENSDCNDNFGLSINEIRYLELALKREYISAREKAQEIGALEEGLFEKINNAFYDNFGDVILEETDAGYAVIEDYCEEISQWIIRIMK